MDFEYRATGSLYVMAESQEEADREFARLQHRCPDALDGEASVEITNRVNTRRTED
jgi:hypothetical protein